MARRLHEGSLDFVGLLWSAFAAMSWSARSSRLPSVDLDEGAPVTVDLDEGTPAAEDSKESEACIDRARVNVALGSVALLLVLLLSLDSTGETGRLQPPAPPSPSPPPLSDTAASEKDLMLHEIELLRRHSRRSPRPPPSPPPPWQVPPPRPPPSPGQPPPQLHVLDSAPPPPPPIDWVASLTTACARGHTRRRALYHEPYARAHTINLVISDGMFHLRSPVKSWRAHDCNTLAHVRLTRCGSHLGRGTGGGATNLERQENQPCCLVASVAECIQACETGHDARAGEFSRVFTAAGPFSILVTTMHVRN